MLMYHTDSHLNCMLRGTDGNFLPFIKDLTSIWFVNSIQNIHKCTFSGTVFPEESMYLPGI